MGSTGSPEQSDQTPQSFKEFVVQSTSLPFGRHLPLEAICGPTYVTAQLLVQHVAYVLSDRLWTYSPDAFDLDLAARRWSTEQQVNAHGRPTSVLPMQVRQGATLAALGYASSKDCHPSGLQIPQSILGSTALLHYARTAFEHFSHTYPSAGPLVAHIAALDYAGSSSRLVADYTSVMGMVDDAGFGLVASTSTYDTQHTAILATLLANIMPMIHIFDGVTAGRETTRVVDVIDSTGLRRILQSIAFDSATSSSLPPTRESRVISLLDDFNAELGTEYKAFEYHGPKDPLHLLVVFGSVESSLSLQVATSLPEGGIRVGVIIIRIFRPFLDSKFLEAIPMSVKSIGVLGQVYDDKSVADTSVQSQLYTDVLGAISFGDKWPMQPSVIDLKYPRGVMWSPISIAAAFQQLIGKHILTEDLSLGLLANMSSVDQYTFWDVDTSPSVDAACAIANSLAIDSAHNIITRLTHDSLVEGGIVRTDIRRSKKTIETPYSIQEASYTYVGDLSFLSSIDIVRSIKVGGTVVLKGPSLNDSELETKLPAKFRQNLAEKNINLYILDPESLDYILEDPRHETLLVQCAFLRIELPVLETVGLQRMSSVNGSRNLFEKISGDLVKALRVVEIPDTWSSEESDSTTQQKRDINPTGFQKFTSLPRAGPALLQDWKAIAKGFAFKEAFNAGPALRPDLSVTTYTIHVEENRRLTPPTYDRNIFHIEFDLGDSGLTYDIGEALGIHPENDPSEVDTFIKFYKLNPEEIVEVASRENPLILESRTVYQALLQNLDIFGRPPKRFYEALAEFADDEKEAIELRALGGPEGANEFKRRAEVDTITYADVLIEFGSAHPSFHDIVQIVDPIKRREYSIASCQKVSPKRVALMIVVVGWVDPKGRDRFGMATRYLHRLQPGMAVTASVKPSVMKLPPSSTQPLIMAGLGTGLAPFRAFVQHRALEKSQGKEIGAVLLYMGSRHQREEYCYGEEWEAYMDAGIITLMGKAFSRDQPEKIYIQDRMRQSLDDIVKAYIKENGAFYLCGPTWPVPDVTQVLEEAIAKDSLQSGKKVNTRKEIDRLKEEGRYVLEVY